MKNFIIGFAAAIAVVGMAYFGYPFIRGFFGGGPVAPESLNPDAKEFGALKVTVMGAGKPVANLEVDLGTPGGRMSYATTGSDGVAFFGKIGVGTYNVFFNDYNFPKEFVRVSSPPSVQILAGKTTEKTIQLTSR